MTFNKKNKEIYSDFEENKENKENNENIKNKKKTLTKTIKKYDIKSDWTEENYEVINYWLDNLRFNHTVNYFIF